MIDEHLRYKLTDHLESKAPEHLLKCMNRTWFRYFGPMEYLVFDQEGAITSDLVGLTCDRYNIKRLLAGKDAHTVTGLAEAHIRLTKQVALKLWNDCRAQGLQVSQEDVIFEAAMSQNLMLIYGGSTPAQGLLGYTPRDYYDSESRTLVSHSGALEVSPDPWETTLRLRMMAKSNIIRGIVEERIAKANHSRPQKQSLEDLKVGSSVDLYRAPDRKDQEGWRGP